MKHIVSMNHAADGPGSLALRHTINGCANQRWQLHPSLVADQSAERDATNPQPYDPLAATAHLRTLPTIDTLAGDQDRGRNVEDFATGCESDVDVETSRMCADAAKGLEALAARPRRSSDIPLGRSSSLTTEEAAEALSATALPTAGTPVSAGSSYWLEWPKGTGLFTLTLSKQNWAGTTPRVIFPKVPDNLAARIFGKKTIEELQAQSDEATSKKLDVTVLDHLLGKHRQMRLVMYHKTPSKPVYLSLLGPFFAANALTVGDVLHFTPLEEGEAKITVWKHNTPPALNVKALLGFDQAAEKIKFVESLSKAQSGTKHRAHEELYVEHLKRIKTVVPSTDATTHRDTASAEQTTKQPPASIDPLAALQAGANPSVASIAASTAARPLLAGTFAQAAPALGGPQKHVAPPAFPAGSTGGVWFVFPERPNGDLVYLASTSLTKLQGRMMAANVGLAWDDLDEGKKVMFQTEVLKLYQEKYPETGERALKIYSDFRALYPAHSLLREITHGILGADQRRTSLTAGASDGSLPPAPAPNAPQPPPMGQPAAAPAFGSLPLPHQHQQLRPRMAGSILPIRPTPNNALFHPRTPVGANLNLAGLTSPTPAGVVLPQGRAVLGSLQPLQHHMHRPYMCRGTPVDRSAGTNPQSESPPISETPPVKETNSDKDPESRKCSESTEETIDEPLSPTYPLMPSARGGQQPLPANGAAAGAGPTAVQPGTKQHPAPGAGMFAGENSLMAEQGVFHMPTPMQAYGAPAPQTACGSMLGGKRPSWSHADGGCAPGVEPTTLLADAGSHPLAKQLSLPKTVPPRLQARSLEPPAGPAHLPSVPFNALAAGGPAATGVSHGRPMQCHQQLDLAAFMLEFTRAGLNLSQRLHAVQVQHGVESQELVKALTVAEGARQHVEWVVAALSNRGSSPVVSPVAGSGGGGHDAFGKTQ